MPAADSSIFDKMTELVPASLLADIRRMIDTARTRAAAAVNVEITLLYWRLVAAFRMTCCAVSGPDTDSKFSPRSRAT